MCSNNKDWGQLISILQNSAHCFPKSIINAALSNISGFNSNSMKKKHTMLMNESNYSSSGIIFILSLLCAVLFLFFLHAHMIFCFYFFMKLKNSYCKDNYFHLAHKFMQIATIS